MRDARLVFVFVAVLLLGLPSWGCKGGNPISGGIDPALAAFDPDTPPSGLTNDFVTFQASAIDGGRITLDVVITEVAEPITGIALKLTYPDSFSKFVACLDGNLFPPDPCFFAEPAPGSGEVFIGRSVTGSAQATPVSGSRVVVRMEFLVFGTGSGRITIEGQNLGGGDASAVLDVNGDPVFVQWFSGMLRGE